MLLLQHRTNAMTMTIHDDDNRTAGKMCNLTRNGGHTISAAALVLAVGVVEVVVVLRCWW